MIFRNHESKARHGRPQLNPTVSGRAAGRGSNQGGQDYDYADVYLGSPAPSSTESFAFFDDEDGFVSVSVNAEAHQVPGLTPPPEPHYHQPRLAPLVPDWADFDFGPVRAAAAPSTDSMITDDGGSLPVSPVDSGILVMGNDDMASQLLRYTGGPLHDYRCRPSPPGSPVRSYILHPLWLTAPTAQPYQVRSHSRLSFCVASSDGLAELLPPVVVRSAPAIGALAEEEDGDGDEEGMQMGLVRRHSMPPPGR